MAKTRESQEGKEKTSLYLGTDVYNSVKFIAFHDDKTQTEIFDEALREYIAKWEKKNQKKAVKN